jgi:hypothetical protein
MGFCFWPESPASGLEKWIYGFFRASGNQKPAFLERKFPPSRRVPYPLPPAQNAPWIYAPRCCCCCYYQHRTGAALRRFLLAFRPIWSRRAPRGPRAPVKCRSTKGYGSKHKSGLCSYFLEDVLRGLRIENENTTNFSKRRSVQVRGLLQVSYLCRTGGPGVLGHRPEAQISNQQSGLKVFKYRTGTGSDWR